MASRHVDLHRGREALRHGRQQPRLGRAAADVAVAARRRGEHAEAVVGGGVLQARGERVLGGPQPGERGRRVVVQTDLLRWGRSEGGGEVRVGGRAGRGRREDEEAREK